MKLKKTVFVVICSTCLMACESHPSFKSSVDAVEGCKKELKQLQNEKDLSIGDLAKVTSNWLEIQDSAYSVFSKDTTINIHSPVTLAYFVISDSIREELKRLAFSQPRSLEDVMFLKLNTAIGKEKVGKSDTYKEVVGFFQKMDKQEVYPDLAKTLQAYSALLANAKTFKKEGQLIQFIAEEDRCFRSLMTYLSQVDNETLQKLTDATSVVFDGLYNSIGRKGDDVNDRTMLYLTLRYNRRIVQNALACKADVEAGKKLNQFQRANYRWMLIQPFLAIDDYSTAALTVVQRSQLIDISKELPSLLNKLEQERQTKEEAEKFTKVLAEYFLKSYLSTSL